MAILIRRRRRSQAAPFDVPDLRAAIGDASLMGLYDCRYGVTLSGGKVSTWDDARGPAGFGPQFVATGAPLPTIDATPAGVGITTDGVQNGLDTAVSTKWGLDQKIWMAYGGTLKGADITLIIVDAGSTRALGLHSNGASNVRTDYTLSAYGNADEFNVPTSGPILAFLESGSAGVNLEAAGGMRHMANHISGTDIAVDFAPTANDKRLNFGFRTDGSNAHNADSVRFIIVGTGDRTRATTQAIRKFASKNHPGIVFPTPRKACFAMGDSLTFGYGLVTPSTQNWFAVLMGTGVMTGYDDANKGNIAVFGTQLANIVTNAPAMVDPTGGVFRSKDICFLFAGTNDVGAGSSSATIIALYQTWLAGRRAAGFKTVLIPLIPRGDCTAGQLTITKAVSDWCQTTGSQYADVVVPLWNNANFNNWTFGASSAENATYYQADKLHITAAGDASIAADVYTAIASIR